MTTALISVIGRPVGAADVSWGQNSFVYVDINGVARRADQVNAGFIPFQNLTGAYVQNLVDGSKNLPLGGSSLAVSGTAVVSGSIYGSGVASGVVKNMASGLLVFGQGLSTADMPSGISALNIGSGTVSDLEFGYLDGLTANIQTQLNHLASDVNVAGNIQYFQPKQMATLSWSSVTTCIVKATTDTPAYTIANGFPDVLNPGQFVTGGLTNSIYYRVTATTSLVFPTNIWGTEKASQWYAVLANTASATALDPFVLKAMPFMRVKSQASQVISLGTNLTPATGIGYGFTNNELLGGKVYMLSGTDKGQLRAITANNNDNTTGGTITYSGTALSLTAGDWFIVLPPSLNFRWIGSVFNNSGSNLQQFDHQGRTVNWVGTIALTTDSGTIEIVPGACPLANQVSLNCQGDEFYIGPPAGANIHIGHSAASILFYQVLSPIVNCSIALNDLVSHMTAVGLGYSYLFI